MGRSRGKSTVQVSVADEYMGRVSEVAEKLRSAGLEIEQVLESTGIITGSVDLSKMERIRKVQGVSDVEPSQDYHLPPPDSEIQ